MTSRERIMTAMKHQEPDHVPLAIKPLDYTHIPQIDFAAIVHGQTFAYF